MRYLFEDWDKIKEELNEKYLFLFLDYDGTLTAIRESPDKAVLSLGNKKLLKQLVSAPRYKVAVISGRALKDIKKMVGIEGVIYVGNHGLEIEGPKIKFQSQISLRYKNTLQEIKALLKEKLSGIKGVFLEDKGLNLAIHYRLVHKEDIPKLKTIFQESLISYSAAKKIKIRSGKMVFEIGPSLAWDKGKVVLWLLARQQFLVKDREVFPVYLGDDITDEDAFRALKNRGLAVFVGSPKESYAGYYLKDTKEVTALIRRILKLPKI